MKVNRKRCKKIIFFIFVNTNFNFNFILRSSTTQSMMSGCESMMNEFMAKRPRLASYCYQKAYGTSNFKLPIKYRKSTKEYENDDDVFEYD